MRLNVNYIGVCGMRWYVTERMNPPSTVHSHQQQVKETLIAMLSKRCASPAASFVGPKATSTTPAPPRATPRTPVGHQRSSLVRPRTSASALTHVSSSTRACKFVLLILIHVCLKLNAYHMRVCALYGAAS